MIKKMARLAVSVALLLVFNGAAHAGFLQVYNAEQVNLVYGKVQPFVSVAYLEEDGSYPYGIGMTVGEQRRAIPWNSYIANRTFKVIGQVFSAEQWIKCDSTAQMELDDLGATKGNISVYLRGDENRNLVGCYIVVQ